MKKYIGLTLFFLFLFSGVHAQDIPTRPDPPRLVNDFANQLNPTEIASLEKKLVAYNDSTSSQIVIVVIPTTGDYPMADYALKLGREWGVGQKDKDNGIVLLWASTDRKIYISVGYGMEGVVPDAIAKRIISQVITPEFKNGMFYRGLDRGVDNIFKYATGEYKADAQVAQEDEGFSPILIGFIIFLIIMFFISRNKGNNGGRGGGYRNSTGPVLWPYMTHSSGGSSSGNWGGGGGGGFGGFGGGSFGGGGAGGDY